MRRAAHAAALGCAGVAVWVLVTGAGMASDPPAGRSAGPAAYEGAGVAAGSSGEGRARGWHGAFLPHGWIATPRSQADIARHLDELARARVTAQIHNLGRLDADGRVPRAEYAGLSRWVRTSRRKHPEQRIYAWISGAEGEHLGRVGIRARVARWLSAFADETGVDGIVLDIEPFRRDGRSLARLAAAARRASPSLWIGISAPPDARWGKGVVRELGWAASAVMPMMYDTAATNRRAYVATVDAAVSHYASTLPRRKILPILPAYGRNPWHRPAVENIQTAMAGVRRAAVRGYRVGGLAVYWWWEMSATEKADWARAGSATRAPAGEPISG